VTLPTLDLLRSYRAELGSTEPLPFGVYGRVLEGGLVRVGDPVTVG
jgi:MOSC domain-containing protein YiiM